MYGNPGSDTNNGDEVNGDTHEPNYRTANQIPSNGNHYDPSMAMANLRGFQMEAPTDHNDTIKQFLWLQQQQQQQAEIHAAFASAAMAEKRLMAAKRSEDSRSNNTGAPYMLSNALGADHTANMMHSHPNTGYNPPIYNPYGMSSSQQSLMFPLGNMYPSQYSMLPGMNPFPNQGLNDSYSARHNLEFPGASGMFDVFNSPLNGQSLIGSMTNKAAKKKKIKDKNKPKRPLSSYNLFFKYERQRILKMIDDGEFVDGLSEPQDPDTSKEHDPAKDSNQNDSGKVADDTSKNKEIGTASSKENSVDGDKDDGEAETKTAEKERDTSAGAPQKKPHGKISFENLAKLIGQRWKELPEEELAKFKALADEDMKRYKDEIEAYLTKKQEQGEMEQQQMQRAADSYGNAESEYTYLNSNRVLPKDSIPDVPFQHTLSQWDRTQIPNDFEALKAMGLDNQYQRQLQESQMYGLNQLQFLNAQREHQLIRQFQQQNQHGVDNFSPDLAVSADRKTNQGEPAGKKQRIGSSPGDYAGSYNQRGE